MKNGGKHVGSNKKRKRSSLSPNNRYSMNLAKKLFGNKRKRNSNSPNADDVDEQVADDVHIDDIEEHQWGDPHPIGKNSLCHI